MKTVGIADLKAKLSEYLAAVKSGEEVLVTERGVSIARLAPLPPPQAADAALEELERAGLVRRPVREASLQSLLRERPTDSKNAVRSALSAEREEGW